MAPQIWGEVDRRSKVNASQARHQQLLQNSRPQRASSSLLQISTKKNNKGTGSDAPSEGIQTRNEAEFSAELLKGRVEKEK